MASDSESAMTDEHSSTGGPFSHPQAHSQGANMGYSSSAHTPTAEMPMYVVDKTDIYPAWSEMGGNPLPLSREEIEDIFDDVGHADACPCCSTPSRSDSLSSRHVLPLPQLGNKFGFARDNLRNMYDHLMVQLDSRAARSSPSTALLSLHGDYLGSENSNYVCRERHSSHPLSVHPTNPLLKPSNPTNTHTHTHPTTAQMVLCKSTQPRRRYRPDPECRSRGPRPQGKDWRHKVHRVRQQSVETRNGKHVKLRSRPPVGPLSLVLG